eukprot:scaffold1391_cov123-Cylindrotheca_fusiformis.AAC.15
MKWAKLLLCSFCSHWAFRCLAWEHCSENAGLCPDSNTCCPPLSSTTVDGSGMVPSPGCIPSDMGKYNGTCCSLEDGGGGCPVGYECRMDHAIVKSHCQASSSAPMADDLTQRLPRYRLCSIDKPLSRLHGLHMHSTHGKIPGKLAYYSSHGEITSVVPSTVDMVWIVIHGAGCNSDDYFCSALAASRSQTEKNVLVLAPWFVEDSAKIDDSFLVWDSTDSNGIWRYGADSKNHEISSYTALDCLIETIRNHFGSPIEVAIAGHSSGGQMGNMRAIVANPSSFLYLTPMRKVDGEWILPSRKACPEYNTWEWGLSDGGNLTVPYRDLALPNASAMSQHVKEFRRKHVIYLAGSLDVCSSSGSNITTTSTTATVSCHSHGLETTCMDQLQGLNRLERSRVHFESLQHVWKGSHTHRFYLVEGVGHDHSYMFNSPEGLATVIGRLTKGTGIATG